VEEAAGDKGIRRLTQTPSDALAKVPRCRELVPFLFSEKYEQIRGAIGFAANSGGDLND
jgi:hypothetical protein